MDSCLNPLSATSLTAYAERYIVALEKTTSMLRVVSVETLQENLLLTKREGRFACTDYQGQPYILQTFDRQQTTSFKTGCPVRSPITDMMQDEFQYMFANAKHRHQTLEKMTKTSVVVSSSLTREADTLLETVRRGPTALGTPSEIMEAMNKEGEKLRLLDMKANYVKKASLSFSQDGSLTCSNEAVESTLSYKKQLAALEAAADINATVERSMRKHFSRVAVMDRRREEEIPFEEEARFIPSIVQERGMIHGAGPEARKKELKNHSRIVQEKVLKQKMHSLRAEVSDFKKESAVLREELVALVQNEAKLQYQLKSRQAEIHMAAGKIAEMTKKHERTLSAVEKYEGLIADIKQSMETVLIQANAGEEERHRLLNLFTRNDLRNDYVLDAKYEAGQNRRSLLEFMKLVLDNKAGLSDTGDEDKDQDQDNNDGGKGKQSQTNSRAYEKVLDTNGVLVIPFFTDVQNMAVLDSRNYWLPYKWMHDRPINSIMQDMSDAAQGAGRVARTVDAAGRQAVTNTPELYMLDVNPKTDDEIRRVKRAIDGSNGTRVLESVFDRTFLNVQFPVQGSIDGSIKAPLKEKWHHLTGRMLLLSGESFTKNGQRIGARVSTASIQFYVAPFLSLYMGHRGYVKRLSALVAHVMDENAAVETEDILNCHSPYERLINVFVKQKLGMP